MVVAATPLRHLEDSDLGKSTHATDMELKISDIIEKSDNQRLGMDLLRVPKDSFQLRGLLGTHRCLIYEPMQVTLRTLLKDIAPLGSDLFKMIIVVLLKALEYLHETCEVIHTGYTCPSLSWQS